MPRGYFPRGFGALLVVVGVSVALVGCGGPPPRAIVKGKVSIGGKSLTTGNVMFWGDKNVTASAAINESGEYVMNDAPIGDVKITVTVPKLPAGGIEKMMGIGNMKANKAFQNTKSVDPESGKVISIMGAAPANVVPIPDKYGNVDSSGLTYTVKAGEQSKDLQLTP